MGGALLRLAADEYDGCWHHLAIVVLGEVDDGAEVQEQDVVPARLGSEMKNEGPEIYELSFTPTEFTVLCEKGTDRFSGLATSDKPKLYVASIDKKPVYV